MRFRVVSSPTRWCRALLSAARHPLPGHAALWRPSRTSNATAARITVVGDVNNVVAMPDIAAVRGPE